MLSVLPGVCWDFPPRQDYGTSYYRITYIVLRSFFQVMYKAFLVAAIAISTLLFGGERLYAFDSGLDGIPLTVIDTLHLSIAKNYLAYDDSDVIVSQFLTDSVPSSLGLVTSFNEVILYNPNILEFIDLRNGANTPALDWSLTKSVTTPGILVINVIGNNGTVGLQGPGEILQMLFHVVTQAPTFSKSSFIVETPEVNGDPSNPIVLSDTGTLLVIDPCVPVLALSATPTASVMELSPNPATAKTSISYFISDSVSSANVQFRIYNAAGSLLRTIDNISYSHGWHTLPMSVADLSNGVYSLEFQAGAVHQFQRLLIIH